MRFGLGIFVACSIATVGPLSAQDVCIGGDPLFVGRPEIRVRVLGPVTQIDTLTAPERTESTAIIGCSEGREIVWASRGSRRLDASIDIFFSTFVDPRGGGGIYILDPEELQQLEAAFRDMPVEEDEHSEEPWYYVEFIRDGIGLILYFGRDVTWSHQAARRRICPDVRAVPRQQVIQACMMGQVR